MTSHSWIFAKRPQGEVTKDVFKAGENPIPEPKDGEVLLRALWISLDPYQRGRMDDGQSYIKPYEVGQVIQSGGVAEVVKSKNDKFKQGSIVQGFLMPYSEYFVCDGKTINQVQDPSIPLNAYLGVLGMPGMTAWLAVRELLKPKQNETFVISRAAGPVGSVAGQILKSLGARVVGFGASDEEVKLLKTLGFDEAYNDQMTKDDLDKALQQSCPNGIDGFLENWGGQLTKCVLARLNANARLAYPLPHSAYDLNGPIGFPKTDDPRLQQILVFDHMDKYDRAIAELTDCIKKNKLRIQETQQQGFNNIPDQFIQMLRDQAQGKNIGKVVVKIADPGQKC